ncbi:jmjC domain-containing protein 5 [Orussus abietinus]|uniref:jmjC domain-containing protein 5 n=1 Tax=Orussus abietinus TaxID=222816 RepID=UPI000625D3C9|nr:jmjC domain-containing protein 5 [Orussus abietinus]
MDSKVSGGSLKECIFNMNSIPWESLLQDLKENVPHEARVHLIPILSTLRAFGSSDRRVEFSPNWVKNSLLRLEACLDRAWESLNSGYWKDVPIEHRVCYSVCSILMALILQMKGENDTEKSAKSKDENLQQIIQQIDKGILLGAPLPHAPDLLTTIASNANRYFVENLGVMENSSKVLFEDASICQETYPGFETVKQYYEPSMETFYRDIFARKTPAILAGCLKHWKALTLWRNADYLMRVAGTRTVPIEIGSRYTEEDWTQHLVSFSDFLQTHISRKNNKVGYLAQHPLFEQIPELKEDFAVPEYCSFSEGEEDVTPPDINAWFGPSGTVSPLHYDPKYNLLCQVFGYKRIILYSPEDTPNLYPYETRLLCNTAQVDPGHPDFEKWPKFRNAKGLICYLGPGEMLFIPPKWWHYVVALTASFSVSFWWN